MTLRVTGLHHLQLAIPAGREDEARAFYQDVLGLTDVAKPAELAGRGGLWFRTGDLRLHLGIEPDFVPATKAHPAFRVADLAAARERAGRAGLVPTRITYLPGIARFYVADPFGNRIEIAQELP